MKRKKKDDEVGFWTTLKWIFIIIVAMIGFIWALGQWDKMVDLSEEMEGRCDGYGYMDSAYDCCMDCEAIGQDYFKYKYVDHGLFSSDEYQCICEDNGSVNKIY